MFCVKYSNIILAHCAQPFLAELSVISLSPIGIFMRTDAVLFCWTFYPFVFIFFSYSRSSSVNWLNRHSPRKGNWTVSRFYLSFVVYSFHFCCIFDHHQHTNPPSCLSKLSIQTSASCGNYYLTQLNNSVYCCVLIKKIFSSVAFSAQRNTETVSQQSQDEHLNHWSFCTMCFVYFLFPVVFCFVFASHVYRCFIMMLYDSRVKKKKEINSVSKWLFENSNISGMKQPPNDKQTWIIQMQILCFKDALMNITRSLSIGREAEGEREREWKCWLHIYIQNIMCTQLAKKISSSYAIPSFSHILTKSSSFIPFFAATMCVFAAKDRTQANTIDWDRKNVGNETIKQK